MRIACLGHHEEVDHVLELLQPELKHVQLVEERERVHHVPRPVGPLPRLVESDRVEAHRHALHRPRRDGLAVDPDADPDRQPDLRRAAPPAVPELDRQRVAAAGQHGRADLLDDRHGAVGAWVPVRQREARRRTSVQGRAHLGAGRAHGGAALHGDREDAGVGRIAEVRRRRRDL